MKENINRLTISFLPWMTLKPLHPDQGLNIKFEIDTNPSEFAVSELKVKRNPAVHKVRLYTPASLLAGKVHAVLCRLGMNRVKGRDFYDYLFCLKKNIPVHLKNLNEKLRQSGYLNEDQDDLDLPALKDELK